MVEVPKTATAADLKAKIEELYEVPVPMQKLAASSGEEAPAIEDGVQVTTLVNARIYLLPFDDGEEGEPFPEELGDMSAMMGEIMGAAQEQMEFSRAMEESLNDVTYQVSFERPASAGGRAAGRKVTLAVDALALVGDVQTMVEVELNLEGEPAFLTLDRQLLAPHLPMHFAGVDGSGRTVSVEKEAPAGSEQQQLLMSMLGGAAPPLQ